MQARSTCRYFGPPSSQLCWVWGILESLLRDAIAFEELLVFTFLFGTWVFIFEVAVGQVVVGFGVRVGIRGETLADVPCLSFRKTI